MTDDELAVTKERLADLKKIGLAEEEDVPRLISEVESLRKKHVPR